VEALKRGFESQKNAFRRQSNDSSSALQSSYHVAYMMAKESKPFSDAELITKYLKHMVQEICLEKKLFLML
jgi:hypothetical protein